MHFSLCWMKLFHRLEKLSRELHSLHLHYITFYNSFREAMKIAQVEKVPDFRKFPILFWNREKKSHTVLDFLVMLSPCHFFTCFVFTGRASQGEHKEAELATACYTPSAFPPCQMFPILRTTFNLCFVVFFAFVCRSLLRMHRGPSALIEACENKRPNQTPPYFSLFSLTQTIWHEQITTLILLFEQMRSLWIYGQLAPLTRSRVARRPRRRMLLVDPLVVNVVAELHSSSSQKHM